MRNVSVKGALVDEFFCSQVEIIGSQVFGRPLLMASLSLGDSLA